MLRLVAATACFLCAGMAVTPLEVNVEDLARADAPDPQQRIATLALAHSILPRQTGISLQLGMELERAGSFAQAEAVFLAAARLDRQYQPAWTLANYYFRRDDFYKFWIWTQRAIPLTNDPRALIRLAAEAAREPADLVDRLGNQPEILRPYLDILVIKGHFAQAQSVASMLRAHHDPADLPRFEVLRLRSLSTIRSAPVR